MHLGNKKALAIIPKVTGPMSLVGSCSILYDILSDRKRKLKRPYYRILLALSTADAITSFWLGLSTWPIPRGTEGVYGAVGTTASCTAQGFFVQLIMFSPMYNLNLSLYYLLLGKYQFTEEQFAKRCEWYMHAICNFLGFGCAILGLPLKLYNNANLWCWIAAYPSGCETNSGAPGDVPCERGHNAWLFRWVIFYGPIWLIIIAVTVSILMLTQSVRVEEKKMIEMREDVRSKVTTNNIDCTDGTAIGEPPRVSAPSMALPDTYRYERSKQIFHQALFYLGAFYVTWLFATINRVYQLITGKSNFALLVLHSVFGPLQGFLNFLIYRHGQISA